jgi:DnaA-homolog protein
MEQMVLDMGLAPRPSLDNFLASGQDEVLAHLRMWVSNPVRSAVPTLLWGQGGIGKTHLLQAVRYALEAQGAQVGWMDAQTPSPPAFSESWSAIIMDDCHLYSPLQQAMAFNWFVNAQTPPSGVPCWVLAAADAPPADLPLREDLRTRLGWGYVFQLHPLAEADCRRVLRRAADQRGVFLSDEVMGFMLNRFSRDLGSLMTLLDHLDGYALRTQRAITIPLIKSMLESH